MLISRKSRLFLIIHLCLTLSLFLWLVFYPFMGRYFYLKSDLLLVESLMGEDNTLAALSPEKAQNNLSKKKLFKELFRALSPEEKLIITERHHEIEHALNTSVYSTKATPSSSFFYWLIWTAFSTAGTVMMLRENKKGAALLLTLPFICLGVLSAGSTEAIGPLEELIVYEKKFSPLPSEDLEVAWKKYLIEAWAGERPSMNTETFQQQGLKGEFQFQLAWAKKLTPFNPFASPGIKLTLFLLAWSLWTALLTFQIKKNTAIPAR